MEVLERFAQGDLEAFENLFQEFQGNVYGWILRIVRDRQMAEDLTRETFWRIYRTPARFHPEGNSGGWARRSNVTLDHLKRARREFCPKYDLRRAAYDLKKLRAKNLLTKLAKSRRYGPPEAIRMIGALVILREKVLRTILDGFRKPKMGAQTQKLELDR